MGETLIIGASAAGLAVAACLGRAGQPFRLVERGHEVGGAWRSHYSRLHLHTPKSASALPFRPWPKSAPRYPGKAEVVAYLEDYARAEGLRPEFGTEVLGLERVGSLWRALTTRGEILADRVVLATGYNAVPALPVWPGLDSFPGPVLHSSAYVDGAPYRGKRVLVVGFGNSGCEIAICLSEHGARPALSARSPVNVLKRDLLGISMLRWGELLRHFNPRLMDRLTVPLNRLTVGRMESYGLRKAAKGPMTALAEDRRIPLLDIGTLKLIREGKIDTFPDIARVDGPEITFTDGRRERFDAVVLATGYRRGLERLVSLSPEKLRDIDRPVAQQQSFGADGLYFCGFYLSPRGMLNEIAHEARAIARQITG